MAAVADLWTWRITGRDRMVDGGIRTGRKGRRGTGTSLDTPHHGLPYPDCGHLDRTVSSSAACGRNPDAAPPCVEFRRPPGLARGADRARRSGGRAQGRSHLRHVAVHRWDVHSSTRAPPLTPTGVEESRR